MHLEAGRHTPLEVDHYPQFEVLPRELSAPLTMYMNVYKSKLSEIPDLTDMEKEQRKKHAADTIGHAIYRNNKMSEVLSSDEYDKVRERTDALLGDCKIGVVCCIDGRLNVALMFGTSADVSKQMAAVLPTEISPDTGKITIDSSTVRVAVVNAPNKEKSNLLELFVVHATSESKDADPEMSDLESNCAAVLLIREKELREGRMVNQDLIRANFDFLDDGVEAVERTYNSSAEIHGKPQLDKIAVRIVYDTESMGFVLNYGEDYPLFTTDLTSKYSPLISQLSSQDIRFQHPGALRFSYTSEELYAKNENMMLDIIELLMTNDEFISEINYACENSEGSELCGLNESQMKGMRYIMARNVAFQYLTGVHLEHLSIKHFGSHNEVHMSIARDDGHGIVVGGMDTESQVFSAATSRIENAVEHIHTMTALMDKQPSPKPYVLFITEGIEESSATDKGSIDSISSRVDNIYKEIQKDPKIAELVRKGDLIMIPVIQTSLTGRIVHIPPSPVI